MFHKKEYNKNIKLFDRVFSLMFQEASFESTWILIKTRAEIS